MGGKLGACHALDLPFVFRQLASPEAEFLTRGRAPQSLSDMMSTAWRLSRERVSLPPPVCPAGRFTGPAVKR